MHTDKMQIFGAALFCTVWTQVSGHTWKTVVNVLINKVITYQVVRHDAKYHVSLPYKT